VIFTTALVTESQYHAFLLADARDGVSVGDGVGNRLVEKDMLAGLRRHSRGLEMDIVGRRIYDRFNPVVFENFLIAPRRAAVVFGGECAPLFFRTRVA